MINSLVAKSLKFLPKKLIWVFSKKYIAGTSIEHALQVCRELNQQGMLTTVDLLGENINNLTEAEKYSAEYLALINRFRKENINGNFSVKPSMFGLHLNWGNCYKNLSLILAKAAELDTFIRIDMEDSTCTSDEIALFRKLKMLFPNRVGLVLQAYLRRTAKDLRDLMELHHENSPLNIRLCKGIYMEDAAIAFKDFQEIRDHFLDDLDFLLRNEVYVGIATHDKYIINNAIELINHYRVPKNKYEFQMLYGVTPVLGQTIRSLGHRIRIYVPYGMEWLNYSIRRLNENPDIVNHIIKAIFIKK